LPVGTKARDTKGLWKVASLPKGMLDIPYFPKRLKGLLCLTKRLWSVHHLAQGFREFLHLSQMIQNILPMLKVIFPFANHTSELHNLLYISKSLRECPHLKKNHLELVPLAQTHQKSSMTSKALKNTSASNILFVGYLPSAQESVRPSTSKHGHLETLPAVQRF
jgi:hypothetical protein